MGKDTHGRARNKKQRKETWKKDNELPCYNCDVETCNNVLSIDCLFDFLAIPLASQTSMIKVHGAKQHCGLAYV
eukprot:6094292-Pyramimonas_sp.AAC.1